MARYAGWRGEASTTATIGQILEQFKTGYGEIEIGPSVVTIVELAWYPAR